MADLGSVGVLAHQPISVRGRSVSGVIRDENGDLAKRKILLIHRGSSELRSAVESRASTGAYKAYAWPIDPPGTEFIRIVLDSATEDPVLNDLIDRVIP